MTKLAIPAAALEQHLIALGKTGSGKSSKLRVIVEHELDNDVPVTILDPKGDWWGLKSSADGKHAGYPIVIFGGGHADVPLNPRAGAQVAELIATGNRPSLIDLSDFTVGERTRFFLDFAPTLFKVTRGRRKLVIDEVHNFAPQGKVIDVDAGKMLHWANRLASEGRGKGITLIAASQRPQKVHKDFVTSCETLIACRVIHKLDRDAIKDWIDGCADPALGKQVLTELANMKREEAWVWSPEIEFGPVCISFPMFKTYDSFKPQAADAAKLKGWAEVDLEDVRSKLAAVVKEAEANDPAILRKRVAELERQLKATPAPAAKVSKEDLKQARDDGHFAGTAQAYAAIAKKFRTVARSGDYLLSIMSAFAEDLERSTRGDAYRPPQVAIHPQKSVLPETRKALETVAKTAIAKSNGAGEELPKGEAAVLQACIQYPDGLRREQLTVLTAYKRSSRDSYIQRLRERGFVEADGDRVIATDAGRAAMPDAEPLPTGEELQEFWRNKLPAGERKILEVLIDKYPDSIARGDLDEPTGFQRSSRDSYLQRLRAKQLITEPSRGEVRASEELFG